MRVAGDILCFDMHKIAVASSRYLAIVELDSDRSYGRSLPALSPIAHY